MTRGSILEYAEALRERYRRATKKQKGKILDEFTQVIGHHRKAALRLLRATGGGQNSGARRGRARVYDSRVAVAHTILAIVYHILRDHMVYQDLGANYFNERDRQAAVWRPAHRIERLGYKVALQAA